MMELDVVGLNATGMGLNAALLAKDEEIKFLQGHQQYRQGELDLKDQELAVYYKHMSILQFRLDRSDDALNQAHRQLQAADELNKESLRCVEQYKGRCEDLKAQREQLMHVNTQQSTQILILQRQLAQDERVRNASNIAPQLGRPRVSSPHDQSDEHGIADVTMGSSPPKLAETAARTSGPHTPGKSKLNPKSASFSPSADRLQGSSTRSDLSQPLFVPPKKTTVTISPEHAKVTTSTTPISTAKCSAQMQDGPSGSVAMSAFLEKSPHMETPTASKSTLPPHLRFATPRPKKAVPTSDKTPASVITKAEPMETTTAYRRNNSSAPDGNTVRSPQKLGGGWSAEEDRFTQTWLDQQSQVKIPQPTIVQVMAVQNAENIPSSKPEKLIDFGESSPEYKSAMSAQQKNSKNNLLRPTVSKPTVSKLNVLRPSQTKTASSTSIPKWYEVPDTNTNNGKENVSLVTYSRSPSPSPRLKAQTAERLPRPKFDGLLEKNAPRTDNHLEYPPITPVKFKPASQVHEDPTSFRKSATFKLPDFSTKWRSPIRIPSPQSSELEEGEIPSSSPPTKKESEQYPKPLFSYDDDLLPEYPFKKMTRKRSKSIRSRAVMGTADGEGERLILREGNWEPMGERGQSPTGTRRLGGTLDDATYAMVVKTRQEDRVIVSKQTASRASLPWTRAARRSGGDEEKVCYVLPAGFRRAK